MNVVADFQAGDTVNVKRGERWDKATYTIVQTWWTTTEGRMYQIRESQETFTEANIRSAYIGQVTAALGSKGGSVTSEAKAEAARRNGRKGGRPRKETK